MKNQLGDIVANLTLLPTNSGGREGPTPPSELRCIMTIEDKNFSVVVHLEQTGSIVPGQTIDVPISFLFLDLAKKYCSVGRHFSLREYNKIANGVIKEILFSQ